MAIHTNRYIYFLLACLFTGILFNANVLGQNTDKFNFRLNAGPALALGQLGSQHYNSGGYALSGFSAAAEGIWYLHPALGVGIAFSSTTFPFADGAYAHDKVNNDPFMESLYLKSGPYKLRTLTAGLYYRKPIAGKFSASGKLTGGFLWSQTPDQLFAASFFTVPSFAFKVTASRSTNATFQPGLAVHYQLFEQVDLSLNADYTIAVAAFGFRTSSSSYVRHLTFSYLNTMIGLNFRL